VAIVYWKFDSAFSRTKSKTFRVQYLIRIFSILSPSFISLVRRSERSFSERIGFWLIFNGRIYLFAGLQGYYLMRMNKRTVERKDSSIFAKNNWLVMHWKNSHEKYRNGRLTCRLMCQLSKIIRLQFKFRKHKV
jgi:hypothetical protein